MSGNKLQPLFLFACLLLLLNSCNIVKPFFIKNKKKEARKEKRVEKKVEKDIAKGKIDSNTVVKKDSLKIPTYDTMLARRIIDIKKIKYTTYQCRAKMHFETGDDKQNFTASFRLEKNKKIWVSISGLGIEVARAIITPDSVKAIERINKKAYLYSYQDIQKLINIDLDFQTLQEIIIGNAIATQGNMHDIKELNGMSTFFIKGLDYTNQITYNQSDSSLKQIQLQTVRAVSTSSILIALNDYEMMDTRYFPVNRIYHIQDVKGAAKLSMEINKADFDKPMDFPFSIPANYKLQR
ncbi:MAG: DUF4292 domain-containing protein [Chitinophagaceae bacterium]|nr:DUF4292 domain-containing protein [Chitinophagaceae bacterium]